MSKERQYAMENIKNISFSTEELSGVMASVWPKLLDLLQEKQDTLFVRPLSGYFEHLLARQKNEKLEPVYCVSISFLNTALMLGRPMCRIDAYGEEWMLYLSPLDTQCVDWAPFTLVWSDLLESLQKILDQREFQKYCSPLQAEQAAWYCIGPILSMVGSMQKYRMDWLMEIPAYRQLIKGDGFRVEFGEFWDWKIILACEKSEVDLFNARSKNQTYHRFQNKVFDGKKFNQFDLSGCVFENCDFRGCVFLKTELNDCRFVNCVFHDVEVRDCQMAGSSIVGSTLSNMAFVNVAASYEGINRAGSWFRPMEMVQTSLDHVSFESCFLEDCVLERCTTTFVTVSDCSADSSDFSILPKQV